MQIHLILFSVFTLTNCIDIYARPLNSQQLLEIGTIDEKGAFDKIPATITEPVCLGTKDLPNHECFAVVLDLDKYLFVVQLDQFDKVQGISVSLGDRKIQKPVKVPPPNLRPNTKKVQGQAQTQTQGQNKAQNEEKEVEKSWIQKNWMYIVPPLLILFVVLGDDEKSK